ncbi:MAG: DUF262 domain-containing protein [Phycisphaerae bacterium]
MINNPKIEAVKKSAAESEIKAKQREVKYDLRDFTIDYIVREFKQGLFFIPEYQRQFVWDTGRKCRFIESMLLGLPIPMMFVAELDDGRLEIVDGAQRIQTLETFLDDELMLSKLERLPSLNGFRFSDLPDSQQRKLGTRPLRLVILDDSTTAETRQSIFDRINTSSLKAKGAEIRRGAFTGRFASFIATCAQETKFRKLCPISEMVLKRRENEELVLRFFAYSARYQLFKHDVEKFLIEYVKDTKDNFNQNSMRAEFDRMLDFVDQHFPHGFAKGADAKSTPRVRFEAISVGVNLALRENPNCIPPGVESWLNSEEFMRHTTTHASNSAPRLRGRLEYVRDKLLGRSA